MRQPVLAVDIDGIVANFNDSFMNAAYEVMTKFLHNPTETDGKNRVLNEWRIAYGEEDILPRMEGFYRTATKDWDDGRYRLPKAWDWFRETFGSSFNNLVWEYTAKPENEFWLQPKAYPEWVSLLKNLSTEYNITFVTSRHASKQCVKMTNEWLEAQGFASPNVVFSLDGKKGWAVGAIGAVGFIDDYYKNCVDVVRTMGTTCKVFVKDTPYNRNTSQRFVNDHPYIHRVYMLEDFTSKMGINPELIPEEFLDYGRMEKRQRESAAALNSEGSLRGSLQSLHERGAEVRQEQLARGNGMDTIVGRGGEASGEVVGGGGTGAGLWNSPSGARFRWDADVASTRNEQAGNGRPSEVSSNEPIRAFSQSARNRYVIPVNPARWDEAPAQEQLTIHDPMGVEYRVLRTVYCQEQRFMYNRLPEYLA